MAIACLQWVMNTGENHQYARIFGKQYGDTQTSEQPLLTNECPVIIYLCPPKVTSGLKLVRSVNIRPWMCVVCIVTSHGVHICVVFVVLVTPMW